MNKLEKIVAGSALLLAAALPSKAQIAISTYAQPDNFYNFVITNTLTGTSSNSFSAFDIPVYGYQSGTAEFISGGSGWSLTTSTPITYFTASDGYRLIFESPNSEGNLQPGSSMTLTLQATGQSLTLTNQTANVLTQGGSNYSGTVSSPGVTPVPEPAAYGAILGTLMLGASLIYRGLKRRFTNNVTPL